MDGFPWQQAALLVPFLIFIPAVESRQCTYITADSTAYTFFCSAYEYCCGNTCCRPPVFKFYQFWYFWLTVILILLLCSGGSWWYRFRYRDQFLPPGTAHFAQASSCHDYRHPPAGVFYYPGTDRVYLTGQPKDPNYYPPYMGGIPAPPAYSAINTGGGLSYQQDYGPPPTGVGSVPAQQPPPPPGFRCLPPSYDSIMENSSAPLGPYSQPPPVHPEEENASQSRAVHHPAAGSTAPSQPVYPPAGQS